MGLLLFTGYSSGTGVSISMLEPFTFWVGSEGKPCLENSQWMLLLKSTSCLMVVMFYRQYLNMFLILFLKISHSPKDLLISLTVISLRLSKDWNSIGSSSLSLLYFLIKSSKESKVFPRSVYDLIMSSQLANMTSSCFLNRSQWISIYVISARVFVLYLSTDFIGGIWRVWLVSITSPRNFGRGTQSQASSFFRNSYFVYYFLVKPQKKRTTSLFLSYSLFTIKYLKNSSTIHLYFYKVQGSFPSELANQPQGSKQGSLRKGQRRCKMPLILSKSANLRWMTVWQGVKVM